MHARSPRRLADRFGIISVILATFDVGFDILGRDQTHHVAERDQFAGPIMSAATGFHGDLGGGKLREEGDQLRAAEIDAQHRPILLIGAVYGEDGLGRVDAYAFILVHGQLPFCLLRAPILAHDAVGPSTPTRIATRLREVPSPRPGSWPGRRGRRIPGRMAVMTPGR